MSSSIIGTSILTLPLSIDASKITTGTLATTVVPDLDASKITTGTLDTARVDAAGILTATNRTLTAGDGLTGGGTLAADRTITLGTPSSITSISTNSVTSTSHTHSISTASIGALTAGLAANAVGSYAFAGSISSIAETTFNSTLAGSSLRASDEEGTTVGSGSLSGTWRCMGYRRSGASTSTVWLRIS